MAAPAAAAWVGVGRTDLHPPGVNPPASMLTQLQPFVVGVARTVLPHSLATDMDVIRIVVVAPGPILRAFAQHSPDFALLRTPEVHAVEDGHSVQLLRDTAVAPAAVAAVAPAVAVVAPAAVAAVVAGPVVAAAVPVAAAVVAPAVGAAVGAAPPAAAVVADVADGLHLIFPEQDSTMNGQAAPQVTVHGSLLSSQQWQALSSDALQRLLPPSSYAQCHLSQSSSPAQPCAGPLASSAIDGAAGHEVPQHVSSASNTASEQHQHPAAIMLEVSVRQSVPLAAPEYAIQLDVELRLPGNILRWAFELPHVLPTVLKPPPQGDAEYVDALLPAQLEHFQGETCAHLVPLQHSPVFHRFLVTMLQTVLRQQKYAHAGPVVSRPELPTWPWFGPLLQSRIWRFLLQMADEFVAFFPGTPVNVLFFGELVSQMASALPFLLMTLTPQEFNNRLRLLCECVVRAMRQMDIAVHRPLLFRGRLMRHSAAPRFSPVQLHGDVVLLDLMLPPVAEGAAAALMPLQFGITPASPPLQHALAARLQPNWLSPVASVHVIISESIPGAAGAAVFSGLRILQAMQQMFLPNNLGLLPFLHVSLLLTTDAGDRWLLHKLASGAGYVYIPEAAVAECTLAKLSMIGDLRGQRFLLPGMPALRRQGAPPLRAIVGLEMPPDPPIRAFDLTIPVVAFINAAAAQGPFTVLDLCMHFGNALMRDLLHSHTEAEWANWIQEAADIMAPPPPVAPSQAADAPD